MWGRVKNELKVVAWYFDASPDPNYGQTISSIAWNVRLAVAHKTFATAYINERAVINIDPPALPLAPKLAIIGNLITDGVQIKPVITSPVINRNLRRIPSIMAVENVLQIIKTVKMGQIYQLETHWKSDSYEV